MEQPEDWVELMVTYYEMMDKAKEHENKKGMAHAKRASGKRS